MRNGNNRAACEEACHNEAGCVGWMLHDRGHGTSPGWRCCTWGTITAVLPSSGSTISGILDPGHTPIPPPPPPPSPQPVPPTPNWTTITYAAFYVLLTIPFGIARGSRSNMEHIMEAHNKLLDLMYSFSIREKKKNRTA